MPLNSPAEHIPGFECSVTPEMRSHLVIDALEMAWLHRSPDRNARQIFHSDRGSQYASYEFQQLLNGRDITPSMSRKGNCWDNACAETLFASLKVERLHWADTFKRFVRLRMRSSIGCSGITKLACTPHSSISARLSMKHNCHSKGQPWQVESRGKQNKLWKSWKSIKSL